MAAINWDDPKCRISRYFTVGEACLIREFEELYEPTPSERYNILYMASLLDPVRVFLDAPINVHSWIRPEPYNGWMGGARESRHLLGLAVDFDCGEDCDETRKKLEPRLSDFRLRMESVDGTSWVHLDFFAGKSGLFTP